MKVVNIEEVEIFNFNFSAYKEKIDFFLKDLTSEEIKRSERYQFDKDRNQFIICRGLLRSIISERINVSPNKIIFNFNAFGKPGLKSSSTPDDFQFNVSHSFDYGLIAVTKNSNIGIDIEKRVEMKDMKSIIENQFSIEENNFFNLSSNKKKCFFDIWVQKEAVVKATGKGFSFGLKHWSVNPEKDKYYVEAKSMIFYLRKVFFDRNYSAALAIMR